jgi:hypothetical protein
VPRQWHGNTRTRRWSSAAHAAKPKLGLNWGESRLHDGVASDLRSNSNVTGGLYFGLTRSLTLTTELSHTQSKDVAGDTAKLDGVATGAILFF